MYSGGQNYRIFVTAADKNNVIKDPVNDNVGQVVKCAYVDAIQEVDVDLICSLMNFL